MKSSELLRLLKAHGIIILPGKGSHRKLLNPKNGALSVVPVHGSNHDLATGTVQAILKQLGLK
jgi:predicted RNA binding protein YcfA (HicA-like mRNA interferase family)